MAAEDTPLQGKPSTETEVRQGPGPSGPRRQEGEFFIVGVGASAGGLEAISDLLKHMVLDSTAVVVVQHLAPSDASVLPALLARNSTYAVHPAQDGVPVRPNNVYLIPPSAATSRFSTECCT